VALHLYLVMVLVCGKVFREESEGAGTEQNFSTPFFFVCDWLGAGWWGCEALGAARCIDGGIIIIWEHLSPGGG